MVRNTGETGDMYAERLARMYKTSQVDKTFLFSP